MRDVSDADCSKAMGRLVMALASRRTADALRHVQSCAGCRRALRESLELSEILGGCRTRARPKGGWRDFGERLLSNVPGFRS